MSDDTAPRPATPPPTEDDPPASQSSSPALAATSGRRVLLMVTGAFIVPMVGVLWLNGASSLGGPRLAVSSVLAVSVLVALHSSKHDLSGDADAARPQRGCPQDIDRK